MPAHIAASEPTFNLPTGSASDFYLSREVNNAESSNHGKLIKKHGTFRYPYLTRRTGDSLVGTNEEITSSELRHGRTAAKTKLGNASSSGSHDFEFSPETFDDQMEGSFRSSWRRMLNDGASNLVTKSFKTKKGWIHVKGDEGTFNQDANGKPVNQIPLFYTENEAGTEADPFGIIKISTENMGALTRAAAETAGNPFGKFVCHEIHCGNTPVKYGFTSRIPITDDIVRCQNFKHVEIGQMDLNVTVNSIVTGSFQLQGSNNPSYLTEGYEAGKIRCGDKMSADKDVAIGSSEDFYSTDYSDSAEKFLSALKATTSSTDTDQFTALEGFLFVNGHQLQFASDLTMSINNNLSPLNAIFVKGAVANTSPKLEVSGNITTYFTDGELDATGTKFGADDLKNLATQNKDVEIIYAFQDKEEPDVVYLFQIFKATFSAPSETKNGDSPITLDMTYNSFGEMAVRCLRLAVPKIRGIEMDTRAVVSNILGKTTASSVDVVLVPNVPLDKTLEAGYVTSSSDSYVFKNAEVLVNGEVVTPTFSNVAIDSDGCIKARVGVAKSLKLGDYVQMKVSVNGEEFEKTFDVIPEVPYVRFGAEWATAHINSKKQITLTVGDTIAVSSGISANSEKSIVYTTSADLANVKAGLKVMADSDVEVTGSVSSYALKAVSAGEGWIYFGNEYTMNSPEDAITKIKYVVTPKVTE